MKKFNPVQYNRQLFGDSKRTKNHPKQCGKDHKFCHMEYEWVNQDNNNNKPVNPIDEIQQIYDNRLPESSQPCTVNYDVMTEENLDDWIAQSINRSLATMLNPQKKFFLIPKYEEQLKMRYRKKISSKNYEDQHYFKKDNRVRRAVSYLAATDTKNKVGVADLYFDYHQLQTKTIPGSYIKNREIQIKPKTQIRRRNAILLINDVHYSRFLKELNKSKEKDSGQQSYKQQKNRLFITNPKEMIYSFNIESMTRKDAQDNVPNSIIEREFQRIKEPKKDFILANRNHMKKQEDIQERIRQAINEKAISATKKIESILRKDGNAPTEPAVFRVTQTKKSSVGIVKGRQGGQKKIQERVMKLLNNMQVISEYIDIQMSKLNIHLTEVTLRHPNSKIQNKWIIKAEEKIKEKENVLAIDCYKQALILQPDFFIPIYNIAVLLQKEKMLSYAKNWFQLAKDYQTDSQNVSYGLSLVQVKQLQFAPALKEIDELISLIQSQKKKVDFTYYYIRALCNKQLGNFQHARLDYMLIIKNSKPSNYYSLSYFLLSVVFAKSRRYSPKFNCLAYMNWRETLFLLFYEKSKRIKEEGMSNTQLADRLIKQPFFNRFSKNLIKKILNIAEYEFVKKDSILFVKENESMILVNGLISIWSHQNSITNPDTVSVLKQGGVLGCGQIDQNLTARPNYWFLAKTDVQVIKISREEFRLFWQGQITFEWDYKYNFLKNVSLFKGLCQATLFKLCEVIQLKKYDRRHILFNDCSYRNKLMSKEGLGFCLGKSLVTDPRFVNIKKNSKTQDGYGLRKRIKSRLHLLIKKHTFKFNQMKFNRLRYPGLFIMIDGKVEVQDDRGFRCKDCMSPRDYFGENLLINSQGFHNYGRMLVQSDTASFYLLSVDKMIWNFTSLDKQIMTSNAKNRAQIQTLRFLRNRFLQCLQIKIFKLMAKKD